MSNPPISRGQPRAAEVISMALSQPLTRLAVTPSNPHDASAAAAARAKSLDRF
jgi:hypothetical protein